MNCDHVTNKLTVTKYISATSVEEFKSQFRDLLDASKEYERIVYILRSERPIPRMKGSSPIIYIGKTGGSLHSRYINQIGREADEYWDRYSYIITTYGKITIDIYKTDDPIKTENKFLYQYHQDHMELPPINLQSYKSSMI